MKLRLGASVPDPTLGFISVFASLASGIVMITIIITFLKIDNKFGLIKAAKKTKTN